MSEANNLTPASQHVGALFSDSSRSKLHVQAGRRKRRPKLTEQQTKRAMEIAEMLKRRNRPKLSKVASKLQLKFDDDDHNKTIRNNLKTTGNMTNISIRSKSRLCAICGRVSTSHGAHYNHLKTHEEKLFKCEQCGKEFVHNSTLVVHMRQHTGEKPYMCTYCGKTFITKDRRIVHERNHTGEKPFKCSYCDKRFKEKSKKKNHERVHTGEKPFKCNICGKMFSDTGEKSRCQQAHRGMKRVRKPRQKTKDQNEGMLPQQHSNPKKGAPIFCSLYF